MATTLSLTETFDGEKAGELLLNAFLTNDSMQYLTVRPDIAYKEKVRRLLNTINVGALTCDFTPTGTVTLDERTITLEGFQVQEQICKKDFLADWTARQAQNGSLDGQLQGAIGDTIVLGVAQKLETTIWQGVNANPGEFDGFIPLAAADGTVNSVAAPAALTSGNIIAKIELLLAEVPTAVENSTEKPMLYMNKKTFHLYRQANAAAGNGWYTYAGPAVATSFMGIYDIAICPGMSDNTMMVAQKSNLWFGTNKTSDLNSVKIKDMSDVDLSDNVRFSVKYFAGVQYGWGNEIALYTV
jgi:hypothetical protein